MLTVKGFGFSANSTVSVGGQHCDIVHVSDTELKCRTPAVRPHSVGVLHTDGVFLEEGLYFFTHLILSLNQLSALCVFLLTLLDYCKIHFKVCANKQQINVLGCP